MEDTKKCVTSCCPWGWLGKKFFGLTIIVWLVFFALMPYSARGIAWTVDGLGGIWDSGEKVIMSDGRPERRARRGGEAGE